MSETPNDNDRLAIAALDRWYNGERHRLWRVERGDLSPRYHVSLFTWADDGDCIGYGEAADIDLLSAVTLALADEAGSMKGTP